MSLFKKILKWTAVILTGGFVILVIVRAFHFYNLDKTNAQVEKIHSTRLRLSDVMGENLPPDPGPEADKTIAGVDANQNGIRDDVELAIFKEYPNSAKTRAALLQYALVLQKEITQSIKNTSTATAIAEEDSRAYSCIGEIVPKSNNDLKVINKYRSFVEDKQLNTKIRKEIKINFDNKVGSFELQTGCDIDLKTLPN